MRPMPLEENSYGENQMIVPSKEFAGPEASRFH